MRLIWRVLLGHHTCLSLISRWDPLVFILRCDKVDGMVEHKYWTKCQHNWSHLQSGRTHIDEEAGQLVRIDKVARQLELSTKWLDNWDVSQKHRWTYYLIAKAERWGRGKNWVPSHESYKFGRRRRAPVMDAVRFQIGLLWERLS